MGSKNIDIQPEIKDILSRFQTSFPAIIDCDDGWSKLIVDCHRELRSVDHDYTIAQIKEKFGGLRYYFASSDPSLYKQMGQIVAKYEKESFRICEVCGKSGTTENIGGLIKTLCRNDKKIRKS